MLWSILGSWITVGIVVPVLIGIGVGVMSMNPPDFVVAKIAFSVAALILAARVAWWIGTELPDSTSRTHAAFFAFVIFGGLGALWITSLAWVTQRKLLIYPKQAEAPSSMPVGLQPRIDALGSGSMAPNANGFTAFASLVVTIINNGSDTIGEDFRLKLTFANGVTAEGFLLTIPEDGIAIDYGNRKSEVVRRDESLDTLAMHPIKGKLQGRLLYAFKGASATEILDIGTKANLSMKDGDGRIWSTPDFFRQEVRSGPNVNFPGLRPVVQTGLRGEFLQTIVGQTLNPSVAVGFVEMTITNLGTRTTLKPNGWSITITSENLKRSGELIAIAVGTKMQMVDGKTYTIGPADAIYEKTIGGINSGDIAHGWIQALFRNATPKELVAAGCKWEVSFEDHTGMHYAASYEYKGNEKQRQPLYYPGGGIKP